MNSFEKYVSEIFLKFWNFFEGTSIALKKREGGGAFAGGGAALAGLEEEEDDAGDDDASSDAGGGGGAAAVGMAIQENLFLDEDVELPEDFE